ncbi:MAG: hypothetical protein ACLUFV_02250 [Acutalibacteraceae bacterium]
MNRWIRQAALLLALAAAFLPALAGCSVGSDSYTDPWVANPDFVYEVTYDALGGTINTLGTRTAYYKENSLVKKPEGKSGMLIEPVNGNKVVLGWYTQVENTGTEENPVYVFDEQYRWDFENDRLNESNTTPVEQEDVTLRTLTLYAHWSDPPTIQFVDADDPSETLLTWTNSDDSAQLSRPTTTEPKKAGWSLLDYYYDAECTVQARWDAGSPTIAELMEQSGSNVIPIYCKFIEGDYTRIKGADALSKITDFSGKYILANDIDMSGVDWTGLKDADGNPCRVYRRVCVRRVCDSEPDDQSLERRRHRGGDRAGKSFGLFGSLDGARFENITLENVTLEISSGTNVAVCVGAFGGRAKDTVFTGCAVRGVSAVSAAELDVSVFAATAAFDDGSCTFEDCTFDALDTSGLRVAEGKLTVNG